MTFVVDALELLRATLLLVAVRVLRSQANQSEKKRSAHRTQQAGCLRTYEPDNEAARAAEAQEAERPGELRRAAVRVDAIRAEAAADAADHPRRDGHQDRRREVQLDITSNRSEEERTSCAGVSCV